MIKVTYTTWTEFHAMFSKKIVIAGFVVTQLILIFFYIYTQSTIIKLTYSFQNAERTFQELQKKKKKLTHELLQEQEACKLNNYATQQLGMKKARLSDIQSLPAFAEATAG